MAEFEKIVETRSSIRGYSDEPLTPAQIRKLLEYGLMAPTARNEQELHFTYVESSNPIIGEIGACLNPDKPRAFLYGAPSFIIISGQDSFGWSAVDAGIAVQNIHLGAADMGLGSVIIGCISATMKGEKKAYFNKALGIPEGYTYQIAIAVGHPTVEKARHSFDFEKNVTLIP